MTRARTHLLTAASLATLLLAGCGSDGSDQQAATTAAPAATTGSGEIAYLKKSDGHPASIAVLGHSGATGEDSDPKRPHEEIRANSWATGTNPAVNSLYLRILAKNPAAKGHNVNLAQGGATVAELIDQAKELAAMSSKPDLVVIQIMDNDIVCPAAPTDYAAFKTGFLTALKTVARGAPNAGIFVVGVLGRNGTYVGSMTKEQRATIGGEEDCDLADDTGRIARAGVARMDKVTEGYAAQLKAGCETVTNCRYDGDAFWNTPFRRAYLANDLNHFTIRGHAKEAAVAWRTLRRVGLLPA